MSGRHRRRTADSLPVVNLLAKAVARQVQEVPEPRTEVLVPPHPGYRMRMRLDGSAPLPVYTGDLSGIRHAGRGQA